MDVVDIVLGGILTFGLIRGFMKGLFVELASFIALIAGIYGAIHFSNFASSYLQTLTDWSDKAIRVTAFTITFVFIVIAIILSGKALTKLADFAALGILNKLLGAIFGTLKMALILSVFITIFEKINHSVKAIEKEDTNDSLLYEPIKASIKIFYPNILEIKDQINKEFKES